MPPPAASPVLAAEKLPQIQGRWVPRLDLRTGAGSGGVTIPVPVTRTGLCEGVGMTSQDCLPPPWFRVVRPSIVGGVG
jgi:hypothetical protein